MPRPILPIAIVLALATGLALFQLGALLTDASLTPDHQRPPAPPSPTRGAARGRLLRRGRRAPPRRAARRPRPPPRPRLRRPRRAPRPPPDPRRAQAAPERARGHVLGAAAARGRHLHPRR